MVSNQQWASHGRRHELAHVRCAALQAQARFAPVTLGAAVAREAVSVSDWASVLPWSRDEAELVTELQGGSDAAFDWLVTHYSGPVFRLVGGILSEPSDAADITQDVFLKAFRGIRGFKRGSSLKTWLYRIAVREALNHRRWLWRHHRQQDSIDAGTPEGHAAVELEATSMTPFDEAASHEVQKAVRQALRGIPQVFRSAVILRDLEGMSYEEVADVLDVSVGTVKSRILRGRRLLREALKPLLGSASMSEGACSGSRSRPDNPWAATEILT